MLRMVLIAFGCIVFGSPSSFGQSIHLAGQQLAAGESRKDVLQRIVEAVKAESSGKHQRSEVAAVPTLTKDVFEDYELARYRDRRLKQLELLAKDLRFSIDQERKQISVSRTLAESTFASHYFFRSNAAVLRRLAEGNPEDPVAELFLNGRSSIEQLIPSLEDHSPTRGYESVVASTRIGGPRHIPRVCDYAMGMIESLSKCTFHDKSTYFHLESSTVRRDIVKHIKKWWEENRSKSISRGIQSQIPHAGFYGRLDMVDTLIRLAESPRYVEFGIKTLTYEVENSWGHQSARAAKVLAKHGDLRAVDVLYERWHTALDRPRRTYDSSVVWFLCRHGGRREWELLTELVRRDTDGIPNAIESSGVAATNPWAVPALGTMITRSQGVMSLNGVQEVVHCLEQQTDSDFGGDEKRARDWWQAVGVLEYGFEDIAARLDRDP